jgi:hypothetical protein
MSENITFSFQYVITIIVVIVVCQQLMSQSPPLNTGIVVLAGLVVSYVTLKILNHLFPQLNRMFQNVGQYYSYQFMDHYTDIGYIHIFPPLLAVFVLFIVLIYIRALG